MEKEPPYEFKSLLNWREKNEAKIAALNKKIEDLQNIQKNQPLKEYHKCPSPVIKKESSGWGCREREVEVISPEKINELLTLNHEIYEENKVIAQANSSAKTLAFDFMARLGVSDKEAVKSKGFVRKYKPAEWVAKLEGHFAISTEYDYKSAQDGLRSGLEKIADHRAKIKLESEKGAREAAEQLKNEERTAFFVKMAVKYKIVPNSPIPTKDELIRGIIEQDKYLCLGHYLLKNREDWSDGYQYAKTGLYFFSVETLEDKEINSEIQALIDTWGGDGRCFRDCEYSYNYLFGKVDPDLYSDYQKLKKY